jgi:hydroxypyruvate isomerase
MDRPRFCAKLSMLHAEHGFLDRFAADGCAAVEPAGTE